MWSETETPFALLQDTEPSPWFWSWYVKHNVALIHSPPRLWVYYNSYCLCWSVNHLTFTVECLQILKTVWKMEPVNWAFAWNMNNNLWSNERNPVEYLHIKQHSVRIHYLCWMHRWKQSTPALFTSSQSSSLDFFLVHGYFSECITRTTGMFVRACDSPRRLYKIQIKHGQKLARIPFYR